MKRIFSLMILLCLFCSMYAANTVKSVPQVTANISTGTAVDYTITGTTPFSNTSRYININDTEHSVVIFSSIRPSEVISKYLSQVRINGTVAVNGTNCIVQMYNRGAIVFPYAKDYKPLTCYSGANYTGTSFNDYGFGNTGGFMNTLTAAQGLNNIKSFKLKRGHMVTFAVGTGGWGYSRCFIAANEDLEISNLPTVLNGKISSYRLFHWFDASKSGVHDTSAAANAALHTTSCFDWGQGNSDRLPDVEWVAHHIYEDWPSAAACGSVNQTCHMKTNNEPGNSADDHPQDVATVLGNWQNLMRTGMRLCSESSHDGSWNHLQQFMQEIDARGWRCDIVDLHGYWDGQWNSLDNYINTYAYGRPVWFSEWLWGASWSNNGAFASGKRSDDATYTGTVPVLQKLIANNRVERFFYWNSEADFTKIWRNGALTKLGEYYANMETGLAYKGTSYVPTVVIKNPYNLSGSTPDKNKIVLQWKDPNGDMVDEVIVQYKRSTDTNWTTLKTIAPRDKTDGDDPSYIFAAELTNAQNYTYRVVDKYEGTEYSTSSLSFTVQAEWIKGLPANVLDYYFVIYSKEASTNLVWTVQGGDVYYQTPATYGSNKNQLWCIEPNNLGGYSFRNMGTPGYLMCSPNSWNFITNNNEYTVASAKANYLPEYNSTNDYWTVKNVGHANCYVGLWDADKGFAAGEHLAANRANKDSGNDSADKLRIYAIPRTDLNDAISQGTTMGTWSAGNGYYLYNVESGQFLCAGNDWGTRASLGSEAPMWNITNGGTSGTYRLSRRGTTNYLAIIDNRDEAWVDRGTDDHCNFNITTTNGVSMISIATNDGTFGTSKIGVTYLGWNGTVGNTIAYPTLQNTSPNGLHWIMMPELAYAQYASVAATALSARQAMWPVVLQAQAANKGADQIAVYNNPASTKAQIEKAKEELEALLGGSGDADLKYKSGTTYHIYNVETGLFLNSGAHAGTQASLKNESAGWRIIKGSKDGLWRLSRKGYANYLFVDNALRLYVDGVITKPSEFVINEGAGGVCTFSVNPSDATYGTSKFGETVFGLNLETDQTSVMPLVNGTDPRCATAKWIIMDDFAYATKLYEIADHQELFSLIHVAQINDLDASAAIAVNENMSATASQISAATTALRSQIESTALFDYSHLIKNGNCASSSQEGWTKVGDWGSNTTYYYNNDSYLNGRFYESWVDAANALGNRSLSQEVSLPNGQYQLSLDVIATRQNNTNLKVAGVTLFLGNQRVVCATGNGVPQTFTTPTFTVTDGKVNLGFEITGTDANWVAFDNFRLKAVVTPGDVNRNSLVSLSDLTQLIRLLLTGNTSNPAADVNGDTKVDSNDIKSLENLLLEK